VTIDQVILAAIVVVVLILIAVGLMRLVTRQRGANESAFGAGGVPHVAIGTAGVAKTLIHPSGVVLAAGEQWSANSASGARIEAGQPVRIVGQDGLTLLVEATGTGRPGGSGGPADTAAPPSGA
jgi:membrane-bound ClpP family serine protease